MSHLKQSYHEETLLISITPKAVCVWLLTVSAWGIPQRAAADSAPRQHRERITVSFRNASLAEVLQRIKQQTGYYILYNSDFVQDVQGISMNKTDVPVREVLDEALRGDRSSPAERNGGGGK